MSSAAALWPRHAHKVHVEEEIDANVAKVEKIGDQAPQLAARYCARAVVQLKRREDVQRTQGCQQKRAREIDASYDGQLPVPVEQVDLHLRKWRGAAAGNNG